MSNKVQLRLEVGDRKRNPTVYRKIIEMPSAPTVGLQLSEPDVVFTIERLMYDIPEQTYYALIIERDDGDWDFVQQHGWVKQ